MKRSISARMIAIFVAIAVVFLICFWVVILYMNLSVHEISASFGVSEFRVCLRGESIRGKISFEGGG